MDASGCGQPMGPSPKGVCGDEVRFEGLPKKEKHASYEACSWAMAPICFQILGGFLWFACSRENCATVATQESEPTGQVRGVVRAGFASDLQVCT